jgi:predicted GH43/DUF377 family glycosyl hydrolase
MSPFQLRRLGQINEEPSFVRYRSPEPVLMPESPAERLGVKPNVVFPTGIDRRDDLGLPDRLDVNYGMADNKIGVARLDLPEALPPLSYQEIMASGRANVEPSRGLSRDKQGMA